MGRALQLAYAVLAIAFVGLLAGGAPGQDAKKPAEAKPAKAHETPLPPAQARVWVIAPSAKGQWYLRIDNDGDAPVLVIADVRLLSFEVRGWNDKRGEHEKKGEVCDGPAAFGLEETTPFGRELVLDKGESYVEAFDPRLICFGKQQKLLAPNVRVEPRYGFVPHATGHRGATEKERGPWVADAAAAPRAFAPVKRMNGPPFVLGGNDQGDAKSDKDKESKPEASSAPAKDHDPDRHPHGRKRKRYRAAKDALGAAMSLTTDRWAEAAYGRDISFEVQAHNVGERPLWVVLRARQLSFRIYGGDGQAYCARPSSDHYVPRDMFELLQPGKHIHIPVVIQEQCPDLDLERPGLYAVVPTLHADNNGGEYGIVALTGKVTTRDPGKVGGTHEVDDDATLLRVTSGERPFYLDPPRATPSKEAPVPASQEKSHAP